MDYGSHDFNDDEFASVEAFVESLIDDERTVFTHQEMACLNRRLGVPVRTIRRELEGYGLTLALREKERHVRGFSSNPHDRWHGPGSCPTHGGSGWSQIMGMAGQEG